MARRATFIRENIREDAYPLIVDAGNFCYTGDWTSRIKAGYLLRAMSMIGYDAINVGNKDLILGESALSSLRDKHDLPFVATNLYYEDSGLLFAEPYLVKRLGPPRLLFWRGPGVRVGIIGLNGMMPASQVAPQPEDDRKLVIRDPYEAARSAVAELKRKHCDVIIALVQMRESECDSLVESVEGIDLLVGGQTSRQYMEPVLRNGVPLVQPGWQGRYHGNLLLELDADNRVSSWDGELVNLDESIADDSTIVALIEEYKDAVHEAEIRQPRPEGMPEVYIGAETCRSCHPEQYEQWESTPHARAYASLECATKEEESRKFECLKCHTTGFRTYNGYWSIDTTPEMANVQCETCHGFAKRHVENRRQGIERTKLPDGRLLPELPMVNLYTCVRCHDEERDPDFDFETDREKVSH